MGLIATNTVAQGDTREVGLDAMVASGFTITRAIQSRSWPAASANLEYAAVWGTLSEVAAGSRRVADDTPVKAISTLLEAQGRAEGTPNRLAENSGIAFQGCIVLGLGFVLEPDEAQEWIAADPRNADVLFPYLNGEDLNSRADSSASRWVIDFGTREREEAATYELPFSRVLNQVKPERDKVKIAYRRDFWWRFAAWAPSLRSAIADLPEVLALARVSKTVMPMRIATDQVVSDSCVVFATDDYGDQAVLSSSLHQLWAITYASTLETRVRYTPSDVFETFPRPPASDRLADIGWTLDQERREIMQRRDLGLTKLYNMVNDPTVTSDMDIARMRDIHVEVDQATAGAFGWTDISLDHGFHVYRQVERWSLSAQARTQVLDRLLLENHARTSVARKLPTRGQSTSVQAAEGTLFD